ncbi:hypothetical protein Marme_0196 [Marinomonas mediterranea MMB-1]|jgi:hypothetical protein|uniref:Uncharacterized protein n=1 Tax=Marinomonas mediterranea (strain ATCC 700492 / JCM 21426 / NBRC 103028 / MMB-1) TaxID=717774 RepID=F2JWB2_MARM1|nr:hypothetical protein Marme_0196 [Marinomonas mediterranea MMB-1]
MACGHKVVLKDGIVRKIWAMKRQNYRVHRIQKRDALTSLFYTHGRYSDGCDR